MKIEKISPHLSVTGQIQIEDIAEIHYAGFKSIICNRPDGETPGQPRAATLEEIAGAHGLAMRYIPIGGSITAERQASDFAQAMAELPRPVLAFCRTGNRSRTVAELAQKQPRTDNSRHHHDILILGGGSAGIATAASMLRRRKRADIAIVEPSDAHYYQPGWTMIGGGVFQPRDTVRPMAAVMPKGVSWIQNAVSTFDPDNNLVTLNDGTHLSYNILVLALGNRLAWDQIDGLEDTLGKNGVTSNYRFDLAPYTWELVKNTRKGRALFTQPPMPIKCAGAPQKAMYLSCSEWKKQGCLNDMEVEFHNAGGVLFGVADYVPALMETVENYGIDLNFGSTLVAVDGTARTAIFETAEGQVSRPFDMLHVCPPQQSNATLANSVLADSSGYADVNDATLQHTRYSNIFAIGDCINCSNAKTAAAARKQAPVVAVNVLAALDGQGPKAAYDGYGSCPLTVEHGKIVLAEFCYGGRVAPTLPTWLIQGKRPSRLAWKLKADALPPIYWHGMLKGREWLVAPTPLQ
ncbi:NAD(FAD)-dependent dehydrogenase [Altericroceibacterium spongiae]|uniref:NAD(FAD)-dependent dehydrogenase n=1 Tax=Altericroceibacterium spongiae TaxID=2320269 RepID=A0A420EP63_9SPHN|nr:bifunctional protein tyrosine phosphatase family protein/NAD(P)/FAD-dependent oxidoreductase [Altericroceibacterium spongiae]RKF22462.1 NAD(FAD)-dependent dehydrogenase [Altericroceibacterium spongiae]